MNRRARLVLFTLATLLLLAGLVVFTANWQQASFLAPGPLARVHTQLEGEEHCKKCHVPAGGLSDGLCLDCHEPLAQRIAAKTGYHAQVQGACQECHAEHIGLDYLLIRWPPADGAFRPARAGQAEPADFPHEVGTGFALSGAHQPLECDQCHRAELTRDVAVLEFKQQEESFLGLGNDCGSCHADAHRPSLGSDCAQCHGDAHWSPAPEFDHAQTRFPLEGRHRDVECDACHRIAPGEPSQPAETPPHPAFAALLAERAPRPFRGVGFGEAPARPAQGEQLPDCFNCHQNPHRPGAELFADCASCHDASSWEQRADAPPFDHAQTGFPLEGAHAQVSCAECHGPKLDLPARENCSDCHDDHHEGAFDREMALSREGCGQCHGVSAWKPATYAADEHPVPLIEGHAIACEQCHAESAGFARLPARAPAPVGALEERCQACHEDVHQGKLSQDCASCHGFASFHLAELDAAGHAELGFPIRDAHLEVTCEGCHGGRTAEGGLRRIALVEVRVQGCVACHEDPHAGQLGQSCADCHGEVHFVPSDFDEARHEATRLPLTGAHRAVPCELCHRPELPQQVQRFKWEQEALDCGLCHEDPHAGQFAEQTCSACHSGERFVPSSFDAEAHAALGFPLTGPHQRPCASCHQSGVAHGEAVTYRGTPAGCAGCHQDPHAGQFAQRQGGCGGCHGSEAWLPARFDHDQSRFPLRGRHAAVACEACHLSQAHPVPGGGSRKVVHYFPIAARDCGDCHQNPHSRGEDK